MNKKNTLSVKKFFLILIIMIASAGSGLGVSHILIHREKPYSTAGKNNSSLPEATKTTDSRQNIVDSITAGSKDLTYNNSLHSRYNRNLHMLDTSIAATVNGVAIRKSVLDNTLTGSTPGKDSLTLSRDSVLENLIRFELFFQEAEKIGIVLSKGAGIIRSEAVKRAYGDKEQFHEQLTENGMTEKEYQRQWYRQAVVDFYIQDKIIPKVNVSDRTLRKLYRKLTKNSEKTAANSFEESKPLLKKMYMGEHVRMILDKKVKNLKNKSDIQYY